MGICNLHHVDGVSYKRKAVVTRYNERLNVTRGIKLSKAQAGVESNYAYYPVIFDEYKFNRDEISEKLKEQNIFARKYFHPITNSFECYKGRFDITKYLLQNI